MRASVVNSALSVESNFQVRILHLTVGIPLIILPRNGNTEDGVGVHQDPHDKLDASPLWPT